LFKQLVIFLATCKNDIDQSATLVRKYFKAKKKSPEFFSKRITDTEKIQKCLKNQFIFSLPMTPDNNYLVYFGFQSTNPDDFNYNKSAKVLFMTTGNIIL
jgi:hypothetical protein